MWRYKFIWQYIYLFFKYLLSVFMKLLYGEDSERLNRQRGGFRRRHALRKTVAPWCGRGSSAESPLKGFFKEEDIRVVIDKSRFCKIKNLWWSTPGNSHCNSPTTETCPLSWTKILYYTVFQEKQKKATPLYARLEFATARYYWARVSGAGRTVSRRRKVLF